MARRHHVKPLERVGFVTGAEFVEPIGSVWKLRSEFDSDFGANFVAAPSDSRTDGGEQIRGLRAEPQLHLADGFYDDALECAAPSGMNGGNSTPLGIDEKNRNAVGRLNTQ